MNIPNKLKLEHRKMRKVVVERQRRDRIERCLEHLKIILQQSNSFVDSTMVTGSSKIEKAELLEMTVNYAWKVHQDLAQQMALGFDSCVREVDAFLTNSSTPTITSDSTTEMLSQPTTTSHEVDAKLRSQLVSRLSRRAAGLRRAACLPSSLPVVTSPLTSTMSTMRRALHLSAKLPTIAKIDSQHHVTSVDTRLPSTNVHLADAGIGHVTTTRPLSDVNGNHIRSNRLKSADNRRLKMIAGTTSIANIENQNNDVNFLSTSSSSLIGVVFPVLAGDRKLGVSRSHNDVIHTSVHKVYDVIKDAANDAHCHQCESTSGFEIRRPIQGTEDSSMEDVVWRPW